MLTYFFGFLKYFFFKNISFLALVTPSSRISRKAKINRFSKVYNSNISDYSYIGPNTELVNATIGKYCSIAGNCNIGLANHTKNFISTSPIFTERKNGTGTSWIKADVVSQLQKEVIIGNDVWIGNKATIFSGINIGNGAIVGANAVVTKDVPNYAVVVGIPAKIIRYRFSDEIIKELLNTNWWDAQDEDLKKNISYFQNDKISIPELDFLRRNICGKKQ